MLPSPLSSFCSPPGWRPRLAPPTLFPPFGVFSFFFVVLRIAGHLLCFASCFSGGHCQLAFVSGISVALTAVVGHVSLLWRVGSASQGSSVDFIWHLQSLYFRYNFGLSILLGIAHSGLRLRLAVVCLVMVCLASRTRSCSRSPRAPSWPFLSGEGPSGLTHYIVDSIGCSGAIASCHDFDVSVGIIGSASLVRLAVDWGLQVDATSNSSPRLSGVYYLGILYQGSLWRWSRCHLCCRPMGYLASSGLLCHPASTVHHFVILCVPWALPAAICLLSRPSRLPMSHGDVLPESMHRLQVQPDQDDRFIRLDDVMPLSPGQQWQFMDFEHAGTGAAAAPKVTQQSSQRSEHLPPPADVSGLGYGHSPRGSSPPWRGGQSPYQRTTSSSDSDLRCFNCNCTSHFARDCWWPWSETTKANFRRLHSSSTDRPASSRLPHWLMRSPSSASSSSPSSMRSSTSTSIRIHRSAMLRYIPQHFQQMPPMPRPTRPTSRASRT